MMSVAWIWSTLLLALFVVMTSAAERDPIQRRVMPGGFAPVEDLKDERVIAAAAFAVSKLLSLSGDGASEGPSYSFVSNVSAKRGYAVTVARAFRQVVAGMNYRVVVILEDPAGSCIGAFAATIYDHFGVMSVTQWGKEITCDQARAILEDSEAFYQTFADGDFN
jgi:hypothetical protein